MTAALSTPSALPVGRSLIVGNDRGGCGKTFAAAAIAVAIANLGASARCIEYEVEPRLEDILHGLYDVEYRPAGLDRSALETDPGAARRFWDELYERDLQQGGCVIDTAANVLTDVMAALTQLGGEDLRNDLQNGSSLGVVVPTTVETFGLGGTPGVVRAVESVLPGCKIWVTENHRDGPFDDHLPEHYRRFRTEARARDIEFITIPRLPADTRVAHLVSHRLDLLAQVSRETLMNDFNLGLAEATRARRELVAFASSTLEAVEPIARWFAEATAQRPFQEPDAACELAKGARAK